MYEPFRIEWQAHEYEHKKRSSDWFWAVGIISVSIAIASIIFGNIIFGILILVAAFSLSLFINRHPDNVHVIVDEKGIVKGRTRYPYSTIHSFWIDVEHPHKKIILRSQKMFMPLITVPLGEEVDPAELREELIRFIPEEYHSLPFVERFIEYLGF
jgi:hypothetical protein